MRVTQSESGKEVPNSKLKFMSKLCYIRRYSSYKYEYLSGEDEMSL